MTAQLAGIGSDIAPASTDLLTQDSYIPPPPTTSGRRLLVRKTLNILLPTIGIALFLIVANWGPIWLGLHQYEVPTLSESIQALQSNWSTIGPALQQSIADALAGFFVGNLLALLGAILFCQSRTIERTWFPLAIVFQAIPIVVIARSASRSLRPSAGECTIHFRSLTVG